MIMNDNNGYGFSVVLGGGGGGQFRYFVERYFRFGILYVYICQCSCFSSGQIDRGTCLKPRTSEIEVDALREGIYLIWGVYKSTLVCMLGEMFIPDKDH